MHRHPRLYVTTKARWTLPNTCILISGDSNVVVTVVLLFMQPTRFHTLGSLSFKYRKSSLLDAYKTIRTPLATNMTDEALLDYVTSALVAKLTCKVTAVFGPREKLDRVSNQILSRRSFENAVGNLNEAECKCSFRISP